MQKSSNSRFNFSPEALAHIRYCVEETNEPKRSIALDLGMSTKTLDRLCKREGIRMRRDCALRDLPSDMKLQLEAEKAVGAEAEAAADAPLAAIAERLENAVEKELAAVERMRATLRPEPSSPADAERTARTLERLTETLSKVRRLRLPEAAGKDAAAAYDMPKDIDEFRHSLARRIEAFVRSRADTGVSEPGESGGTNPSQ